MVNKAEALAAHGATQRGALRRGTMTLIGPQQQAHRVVPLMGYPGAGMGLLAGQLHAMEMALGGPLAGPSMEGSMEEGAPGATHVGGRGRQVHQRLGLLQRELLARLGCVGDGLDLPDGLMAAERQGERLAAERVDALGNLLDGEFGGGIWGFADPRTAPMWPFWTACFAALHIDTVRPIIVLRRPAECWVPMLRDGAGGPRATAERAAAAWIFYYSRLEALSPHDALWVSFDALRDPARNRRVLARCARYIGLRELLLEPAHALLRPRSAPLVGCCEWGGIEGGADALYARLLLRTLDPGDASGTDGARSASSTLLAPSIHTASSPGNAASSPNGSKLPDCIYLAGVASGPESWPFSELSLTLFHAFRDLGRNVPVVHRPWEVQGTPLVLGPQLLTDDAVSSLPDSAILYNLEQVSDDSTWFTPNYMERLRRHRFWDYSERNLEQLRRRGLRHGQLCPVGSHPALCGLRMRSERDRDIDVLFYGALNARRRQVLSELSRRGLRVTVLCGVYGAARDSLIERARLVLNVHFYEAQVLETVRLSYLMANGVCVLTEQGAEPELECALLTAGYGDLVNACERAVKDPERRAQVAERARAWMTTRVQADYVRSLFRDHPRTAESFVAG